MALLRNIIYVLWTQETRSRKQWMSFSPFVIMCTSFIWMFIINMSRPAHTYTATHRDYIILLRTHTCTQGGRYRVYTEVRSDVNVFILCDRNFWIRILYILRERNIEETSSRKIHRVDFRPLEADHVTAAGKSTPMRNFGCVNKGGVPSMQSLGVT